MTSEYLLDLMGIPLHTSWLIPLTRWNPKERRQEDIGGFLMEVPTVPVLFSHERSPRTTRTEMLMHPIRAAQALCPDLVDAWATFLGLPIIIEED